MDKKLFYEGGQITFSKL